MLNVICSNNNGRKEELEMSEYELIEWVWNYYAYEEFDSIMVDGVEVAEKLGMDISH